MKQPLSIVILGLSLSSSWGNGHATTWRALARGLRAEGHRVLFLERDVPWYAENRDLPDPDFCDLVFYSDLAELGGLRQVFRDADAVIVGSFVPEGIEVIDLVAACHPQRLCFYDIDTPVTLALAQKDEADFVARRQFPLFDVYFSFAGGDVLGRLEREFGARKAAALYCCVDEEGYFPTGEDPCWDLGYLGTYSPDRQPALERLLVEPARQLPAGRFVVAGPQYPDQIDWPSNVERIDHLPPAEHLSFYNRQRFTLNVTRADMVAAGWSPSVRLFEAAACGTPILSDEWPGLTEIFDAPDSVAIVRNAGDVVRLLSETKEADRQSRARSARETVLASHTGRARARELVEAIRAAPAAVMPARRASVDFQVIEGGRL